MAWSEAVGGEKRYREEVDGRITRMGASDSPGELPCIKKVGKSRAGRRKCPRLLGGR